MQAILAKGEKEMNKLNFKCYDSPFATRLRLLMTENGTKQNIIAELLGVTRQSVSQYCDGTSVPPVDKIIILANYYNVSTDYILGVSDNNAPNDNEALKTACGYTGLSGNAVNMLSK
jgi:transcriptional regulator with XRE-family HTH domain